MTGCKLAFVAGN